MGVPEWNTPFADFERHFESYYAKHHNQAIVSDLGVQPKL
jgi:hypothetical protein